MSSYEFKERILDLINSKREGPYWNFKREWHNDNNDLLVDILCFANNLVNKDCYIIIGVDEENDYSIRDISKDSRKKEADIRCFLNSLKFAGDNRPSIKVETLKYNNCFIDVLIIENSFKTPFYLKERYQKVNQNNIYIRKGDSNTGINSSADIEDIAILWKKRFHIDLTPLEKATIYLADYDGWEHIPESSELEKFYKLSPEFVLYEVDRPDLTGYSYINYLCEQEYKHCEWTDLMIKYFNTPILCIQCITIGGRYIGVYGDTKAVYKDKYMHEYKYCFRYYLKGTTKYSAYQYFCNAFSIECNEEYDKFMLTHLIFDNSNQLNDFYDYLLENDGLVENKVKNTALDIPSYIKDSLVSNNLNVDNIERESKYAIVVHELYIEFMKKH